MPTPHLSDDLITRAQEIHLRYIDQTTKGITRAGNKTKFYYFNHDGSRVIDKTTKDRITSLVIPPAWTEVWISPHANTHLQATGLDIKGRKQYIYHKAWERLCQEAKFDRVELFGQHLPTIRERLERDMTSRGLTERRILATVVWLLEHTFIRVGNEEYARENQSFGLTTLRNRHVDIDGDRVRFAFTGKSGIDHEEEITNPIIVKTIKKCIELPGYEVFQYLDENRERKAVDSAQVNDYLQDITREKITAKDFRTWGGTMLSAQILCQLGATRNKEEIKSNLTKTTKRVSRHLGNTPKVCRSYYIHPAVFKSYEDDILIPYIIEQRQKSKTENLKPTEFAVLELLRNHPA